MRLSPSRTGDAVDRLRTHHLRPGAGLLLPQRVQDATARGQG
jgi:hypothetical protein